MYREMTMKNKEIKTIYYTDELNDEFSTSEIKAKRIDGSYNYDGGKLRGLGVFIWYRLLVRTYGYLLIKLKYHHRIVGREKLKNIKEGFFFFGNHTNDMADAFIPAVSVFPKYMNVIVHPDNVSIPFLGKITPSLGAIPLPDDMQAGKNFVSTLRKRIDKRYPITIYPEAHIWPYYTKIRHFSEKSFGYPLMLNAPVYCFTNTYQKRKHSDKPDIVTYIDGPFTVDKSLPKKEQKTILRDKVYSTMVERSKNSNIEVIRYIKKENL